MSSQHGPTSAPISATTFDQGAQQIQSVPAKNIISTTGLSESPGSIAELANADSSRGSEAWPISSSQSSLGHASQHTASQSSVRAISEPELIAFVVEKRLMAGSEPSKTSTIKDRPGSSNSKDASKGSSSARKNAADNNSIDTLDLCHMRIDEVPQGFVDIIKDDVVRLALGYNFLTKVPDNFAQLSCVRYLNIRANNISSFPAAVCEMANLEILDISRNKIRELPEEPGRLLALRVLSMNSNRLSRLPTWVGKMKHLRILKLENNPLEWPPPHVSRMPTVTLPRPPSSGSSAVAEREIVRKFEDRQMVVWIAKLRNWINDNQQMPSAESSQSVISHPPPEDPEAVAGDLLALPVKAPPESSAPSQTSESVEQEASQKEAPTEEASSASNSMAEAASSRSSDEAGLKLKRNSSDRLPSPPPPLPHTAPMDPVPPMPKQWSPYSDPVATSEAKPSSMDSVKGKQSLAEGPYIDTGRKGSVPNIRNSHTRNNSHSIGQAPAPLQPETRRTLKVKKSLPDMRLSHEDILSERRSAARSEAAVTTPKGREPPTGDVPSNDNDGPVAATTPSTARRPMTGPRRPPLPQSASNPVHQQYKNSGWMTGNSSTGIGNPSVAGSLNGGLRKLSLPTVGATQAAAEAAAAALASRSNYTNTPPRSDGHGRMPSEKGETGLSSRSNSPTLARNPADLERNSYFRRLSTLPPSTISKTVPLPVLKFIDGTRGVLFALSQIHTALKQYIMFATDERISSQFNRVLDIASGSMTNFINSLDRFDSLSRRGTPEPNVIRGVLLTCKESVLTFRKVVSVLQLQLRALQSSADVRFTRTLLLMLYGSMAEVSNSWTSMAPQVDAVLPYLSKEAGVSSPGTTARPNTIALKSNVGSTTTSSLPSIAEGGWTMRAGARPYVAAQRSNRRRHAGSFSAHDVAQGATIPPSATQAQPFNLEDLQASSVYNTPARSARSKSITSNGGSGSADYFGGQPSSGQASGVAPSTPGAASSGYGSFAQSARTTAPSSVSASPARAHRSTSNASSAGEGIPGITPLTQQVPSSSTKAHGRGGSNGLPPSVTGESATIDDHLIMLVDQITNLSAEVWTALLDHLSTLGVQSEPSTPTVRAEPAKKLHDLRDLAHDTAELTSKLRETLLLAQEEGDAVTPDIVTKLFEQAHHFVRAVVNISTLIKAISDTHTFPRDLRRSLGEVTHGCSALTVHLLWLSPTSIK